MAAPHSNEERGLDTSGPSLMMYRPRSLTPRTGSRGSLRFDTELLDDRPPLLDVGLLQCTKRLRRLPVARRYLKALIGEPLANRRIG